MKKSIIILLCLFWTLYGKAQGVEYQTFIYTSDELADEKIGRASCRERV